jgi:hypothetical protein
MTSEKRQRGSKEDPIFVPEETLMPHSLLELCVMKVGYTLLSLSTCFYKDNLERVFYSKKHFGNLVKSLNIPEDLHRLLWTKFPIPQTNNFIVCSRCGDAWLKMHTLDQCGFKQHFHIGWSGAAYPHQKNQTEKQLVDYADLCRNCYNNFVIFDSTKV